MKNLIIRKAKQKDLKDIIALVAQLGYPQKLDEFGTHFEYFCNQKDYGVVVAEINNKIVGLVTWSAAIMLVMQAKRLRIEGLVVDKKYRGQGVGRKLMDYVEEFAKQLSPCVIEITSGIRRKSDGSHEFYNTIGYRNEGQMAKLYLRKKV